MQNSIINAREFFNIEKFPGNLFEKIISTDDYIERYKILVFKDDLDHLSGFVGYKGLYAYIGINYNRPIGHQNFTLAHEIGHFFLNHLNPQFDTDENINQETKAHQFALEFLYPEELFIKDFLYAENTGLFYSTQQKELAIYLDALCHKYFLSYQVIYNRFFYKYYRSINKGFDKEKYKDARKHYLKILKKSLGNEYDYKYTNLDPNFHIAKNSSYCKKYYPISELKSKIDNAVEMGNLGYYTGEAILFDYITNGEDNYGESI